MALFLARHIADLRIKIAKLDGVWQQRWKRFLDEAKAEQRHALWYASDKGDVPLHAAFAYLVTGERYWAEIAQRDYRYQIDNYAQTLQAGHQDLDTWMYAAPMARRAIGIDWIWESGVLSPTELAELADFYINDSLKYPYVMLQ